MKKKEQSVIWVIKLLNLNKKEISKWERTNIMKKELERWR